MNSTDKMRLKYAREVLEGQSIKVFVDFAGGRRLGLVTRINQYSTWVKIMMGANYSIVIKRNNKKRHVNIHAGRLNYDSIIYPTPGNTVNIDEAVVV